MFSGLLFSVIEAEQSGYFGSDGSEECFLESENKVATSLEINQAFIFQNKWSLFSTAVLQDLFLNPANSTLIQSFDQINSSSLCRLFEQITMELM